MKQPQDRSRRGFLKASSMVGLAVAISPATIGEAFADAKSKTYPKDDPMTESSATRRASEPTTDNTAIRPFHKNFRQVTLLNCAGA